VAKAKWGLGHVAVRTLYKGLFVPITSYAAADWNDLLNDKAKKKTLIRSQRMTLPQATKTYKTSTESP
jgi:hypothetical protein